MNTRQLRMTGQQRVSAMLDRRDHDRIPRHDTYWGETIERWKGEGLRGGSQGALDALGSDFANITWIWPMCFPGQNTIVDEDDETRVTRDGQGKTVRYWKNRAGTPEHMGFDCDSREKWEKIYKPALLNTGLQLDPSAAVRNFRKGRDHQRWTYLAGVEGFEETRSLMGDELTAMALIEDPEWVRDVVETFFNVSLMNYDAVMATGIRPDGLWIYGDMAYNHATFCSPAMYRDLFWPVHKRFVEWAHAHRMKFIYHTDGNVNGVIDQWLDAGFDCFQPIEAKAQMDIRQLVPKYGDKLAFFGNIDVMVMGTNDPRKIEDEVRSKLEAGMSRKCYAYHSDHSVPPQVSWKTYQFIIELLDKYGWYE